MPDMVKLALARLRLDGGTQQRVKLSDDHVTELAQALLKKKRVPPPVAFHDGKDYWLADGFHTVLAHKSLQRDFVVVEVRSGSQRDAVLYSCGANAAHGLKRSNDDKRKAVLTLLADAEWSQWSDHRLADAVGVSHTFVAGLRPSGGNRCHLNQTSEVADSHPSGGNGCHPTTDNGSIPLPNAESSRRVGRDGKTYPTRRTPPPSGIKKKEEAEAAPAPDSNGQSSSSPAKTRDSKTPKAGSPLFDDRQVTDLFGKLARLLNDRSKVVGSGPLFQSVWDRLNAALEAWQTWQKEKEVVG